MQQCSKCGARETKKSPVAKWIATGETSSYVAWLCSRCSADLIAGFGFEERVAERNLFKVVRVEDIPIVE